MLNLGLFHHLIAAWCIRQYFHIYTPAHITIETSDDSEIS